MSVLKAYLLALALPPVCFLYLAILGFFLSPRQRRAGRALIFLGLAGLTILALPAAGGFMIIALEQDLPITPPANAMPQAIVILGGDVSRMADPPLALPGFLSLDRERAGAALQRRTGLPILVTGGTVEQDRAPVATLMAASLRDDFQVPVVWVEDASVDTWQNATLSAEILKKQGIHSIYVVTQAWHMRRAILAFRHTGLIVTAAPTERDSPIGPVVWDFVPRVSGWEWSYFALHEWIGCAWYALH